MSNAEPKTTTSIPEMTSKADRQRGPSRAHWARAGKIFASVGALLLLVFTFRNVDMAHAARLVLEVGPFAFIILLPFGTAMVLDTIAWRSLFSNLKRRLKFRPLFAVRVSSEAMLMSLSGGAFLSEGVAPVILKRRHDVPVPETVATCTIRRLLIAVSQSIYLGIGVLLGLAFLREASNQLVGKDSLGWVMLAISLALLVGSLFVLLLVQHGRLGIRLHAVLSKIFVGRTKRWLEKIEHHFAATDRHVAETLRRPFSAISPAVLFFVAWVAEAVETYLILRLLGVEVSFVYVWAFEPIVSLLRHAMFFVPAGIGFQEAGYVFFLRSLGIADPVSIGAAFALLKRMKEAFFILLGFGLLAIMSARTPVEQVETA